VLAHLAIACPSCAMGQGRSDADSLLLVAALILLPFLVASVAGLVIAHLVRRPRP
jgi:hypothetical protein